MNRSKIKKTIVSIIPTCLLTLIVLLMSHPIMAFSEDLTASERAYLNNKGPIVFVSQTVYPPFEFVDKDGDHTGMCIELVRWMSTEFGFKTRFTDASFKNAQESILLGEADVLTSFFYSENRDKFFDFTQMVYQVPAYIFVASDRPDIKAVEDLDGKTIAMQLGDYAQEFLESHHVSFNVINTRNFAEATDLVIAGKADALIGDEQIVLFHIYSNNLTLKIKKVGEPLFTGQNCMSVKEGNHVLLSILKKGITIAQEKGVLERINRKWLGVTYSTQVSFWEQHKLFIGILTSSLALVLVLVWSWNTKLRKEVNRRTHALAKSENTLKTILAASPVGIGILRDRKIDWMNDAMTNMLGFTLQEIEGKSPSLLYSDSEQGREVDRTLASAIDGNTFAVVETRWHRKNGTDFDCLLRYAPVHGADHENFAIAIAEDITERKHSENKLRRAKAEWERTFDTVPDMIMILDEHHCIQKMNRAMNDALAMSTPFSSGLKCYECVHGLSAPPPFCPHSKLIIDGQEHTAEVYEESLNGHFMVSVTPLTDSTGQVMGSVHVARNITERKVYEERIQKLSTLRAKLIQAEDLAEKIDVITNGIADLFSSVFFRIWMAEEESLCIETQQPGEGSSTNQTLIFGNRCFNLLADSGVDGIEDRAYDWILHEHDFLEQLVSSRENKLVSTMPGRAETCENHCHVGFRTVSSTGSIIGIFSIFSDHAYNAEENNLLEAIVETTTQILEAERAAKALKDSEKRYRHLFESLIDVYFRTDASGKITMVSPSVEQVTGISPNELLGTFDIDYYVDIDQHDHFKTVIKNKGMLRNQELLLKKKEGAPIWVSFNAKLIEDRNGDFDGVEGLFRDITKNKQAEELMRIQRDLGTALGHTCSLGEALNVCLDAALKVQGINCGGIYMIDSKTGGLELMVHHGMHPEFVDAVAHLDKDSPQATLVFKGKALFQSYFELTDSLGFCHKQKSKRETFGFRAVAVVPMFHEGNIIGCLNVASTTTDTLSDFSQFSLETIAAQMAGALIRIKMDQALKVSQHNLTTLFESLDDFLFILNGEGNIVEVNPSVEKCLGYSKDTLANMNVTQLHPPERRQEASEIIEAMLAGQTDACPVPLMTRDGRTIPVETKVNVGSWNGQPALFGISRDISRRLEAEEARRISEDRLKAAIDVIDEGFVLYDAQDRLVMCNSKYRDIYKDSMDLIRPGSTFEDIIRVGAQRGQYVDAKDNIENWVSERLGQHRRCDSRVEQQLSDGRWVRIAEQKMNDGSTVGFRVDITDIKRAGELAQKALQEKEILLKEIHHRVKNNMQVVSSLLSLQANKIEAPDVLEIFAEAQGRVQSMALVHETLYRSDDLTQINLQDYLERLISQIVHLFHFHGSIIDVKANAVDVSLNVDQAATCGLIVVELLTNSLKYAFPDKKSGSISISAKRDIDDKVVLNMSDNGVGLPKTFDPRTGKTLGLNMVIDLVEDQLEGTWTLNGHDGVHWAIVW